jgi:hypothetical protein
LALSLPPQVREFHNIMPIENIPSVMEHGILSHERIAKLPHRDVSMAGVQNLRDQKRVPNGLRLHQYANLYFDARNPMMYRRKDEWEHLCVLQISTDVLEIPGVVLTDCNAASSIVKYLSPQQINELDFARIYAQYWTHEDAIDTERHKKQKCAEVLIPYCCPPQYIMGAYVRHIKIKDILLEKGFHLPITIHSYIFFG